MASFIVGHLAALHDAAGSGSGSGLLIALLTAAAYTFSLSGS
jgi:hypothetical protein